MGTEEFLNYDEKRNESSTVNDIVTNSQLDGTIEDAIVELTKRLEAPVPNHHVTGRVDHSSNSHRHIGILAGLKILGRDTTQEIVALFDCQMEIYETLEYPYRPAIFHHFFDILFDKYGTSSTDEKEARKFLEDYLIHAEHRTPLLEAYIWRWSRYKFKQIKGPKEGENIEPLLSLFINLEFLWSTLTTGEKVVYLDLLLLEGSQKSLIKIIELTKNKVPRPILQIRVESLFLLYRDFPESFHFEDPEYYRRKIKETPKKTERGQFLEMLTDLIERMNKIVPEEIGQTELTEIGVLAEKVLKSIKKGRWQGRMDPPWPLYHADIFPKNRNRELWYPTIQNLVNLFISRDHLIMPIGVAQSFRKLEQPIPKSFFEEHSRSEDKVTKINALDLIDWKDKEIEDVVDELRLFSKDPDRNLRAKVIGILDKKRNKMERKDQNFSKSRRPIDDLLTEMSQNPHIQDFEKKRILVALGRASYGF